MMTANELLLCSCKCKLMHLSEEQSLDNSWHLWPNQALLMLKYQGLEASLEMADCSLLLQMEAQGMKIALHICMQACFHSWLQLSCSSISMGCKHV